MARVSVVIPVRNEQGSLRKLLGDIRKYLGEDDEIIVVDNASEDSSSRIASQEGVKVIKEESIGFGNALQRGAREAQGEVLLFIDGDGTYPASNIPLIIETFLQDGYELVYGSRFLGFKSQMPFIRYIGNRFLSFLASSLYGRITDLMSGLKAIRKEKFLSLDINSPGFEIDVEIFKKARRLNLRIGEIPIVYNPRYEGSKLRPLKDGFRCLGKLLLG